jgi:hypothetical protein
MAPFEIEPCTPHRFWPHLEAQEDTVLYLWVRPDVDELRRWEMNPDIARDIKHVTVVGPASAKYTPKVTRLTQLQLKTERLAVPE